jgi:hypothetical protein
MQNDLVADVASGASSDSDEESKDDSLKMKRSREETKKE